MFKIYDFETKECLFNNISFGTRAEALQYLKSSKDMNISLESIDSIKSIESIEKYFNICKLDNIINLSDLRTLLQAYFWDCPRCHATHTENVLVCSCDYNCDDRPLYKLTSEQIVEFLTKEME